MKALIPLILGVSLFTITVRAQEDVAPADDGSEAINYSAPVVYQAPVVYMAPVMYAAPVMYMAPVYYMMAAANAACPPQSTVSVTYIGGSHSSLNQPPNCQTGVQVIHFGGGQAAREGYQFNLRR